MMMMMMMMNPLKFYQVIRERRVQSLLRSWRGEKYCDELSVCLSVRLPVCLSVHITQ